MTAAKHIVIDARESGTSTGRYIDKLIEHLHQLEPEHRISLLAKPHRLEYLAAIAPRFAGIESPHKEFSFAEQIQLKQQIDSLEADLVHFTMVQQPVLYRGPVVTTMHDLTTARFHNPDKNQLVFTIKQQVYKWVNKRVARKSAAIITPSEFVRRDVVTFCSVSADKINVTYESADDLPTPAQTISGLTDKQFIMYIGRPTPHKNLDRLIEAFQKLQADHPDLHLVLAGKKDANYRRIEASVQQQGISNVFFTDFISDQQLRWLYQNCAAYVFPSLSEGFGLPGLEAMRHGAPVASSKATCLPEIYGDAALYFDPFKPTDIAAKVHRLLNDDKLRQAFIVKGKHQADKYSWQRMAQQTLDVYDQILLRSS